MNHLEINAIPNLTPKRKRVLSNWTEPKTMKMVSIPSGVYRSTVCGMMPTFEKYGLVELVGFDYCKESGNRAGYYKLTSNGAKAISL